jgi:hypothetical protein
MDAMAWLPLRYCSRLVFLDSSRNTPFPGRSLTAKSGLVKVLATFMLDSSLPRTRHLSRAFIPECDLM